MINVASSGSTCVVCGAWVALHAARPRVTVDGRVQLECVACASGVSPAVAAVEAVADEPSPTSRRRRWAPALGVAGLVGAVALASASIGRPGHASAVVSTRALAPAVAPAAPAIEQAEEAQLEASLEPVAPAGTPPRAAPSALTPPAPVPAAAPDEAEAPINHLDVEPPPIPERDGEPLDQWLPTLLAWTHPIPGSPEIIPRRDSRRFGARRTGHRPHQCGGGHCGVDLTGERGQTVVAVAWGTVLRINRDAGGLGGRYVRIEHPDQVLTTYFHLDDIAPDLAVGQEIQPGQPLGTVGATGISVSAPHLHFSLEILDHGQRVFLDPAPFLARAEVLRREDVPEIEPARGDSDIQPE